MPKKFFDDEFKAKKVWQDYLKRSKSATTFKIRQAKSSKQVSNNPFTPHNAEVVIRVTGSSCDFNRLKAHLRYISRNGELEVFDKDGGKTTYVHVTPEKASKILESHIKNDQVLEEYTINSVAK